MWGSRSEAAVGMSHWDSWGRAEAIESPRGKVFLGPGLCLQKAWATETLGAIHGVGVTLRLGMYWDSLGGAARMPGLGSCLCSQGGQSLQEVTLLVPLLPEGVPTVSV